MIKYTRNSGRTSGGIFTIVGAEQEERADAEKVASHEGECFSINVKDDMCFSLSVKEGECFSTGGNNGENDDGNSYPSPVLDFRDLDIDGFSKVIGIYSDGNFELYAVIEVQDDVTLEYSFAIIRVFVTPSSNGGVYTLDSKDAQTDISAQGFVPVSTTVSFNPDEDKPMYVHGSSFLASDDYVTITSSSENRDQVIYNTMFLDFERDVPDEREAYQTAAAWLDNKYVYNGKNREVINGGPEYYTHVNTRVYTKIFDGSDLFTDEYTWYYDNSIKNFTSFEYLIDIEDDATYLITRTHVIRNPDLGAYSTTNPYISYTAWTDEYLYEQMYGGQYKKPHGQTVEDTFKYMQDKEYIMFLASGRIEGGLKAYVLLKKGIANGSDTLLKDISFPGMVDATLANGCIIYTTAESKVYQVKIDNILNP